MFAGLGVAGQEKPRRRIVGVGIGAAIRDTGEFGDPPIGLVPETDSVDQTAGEGVVAQQWGAVSERVQHGHIEATGLGDTLPHLSVQAFDQPAVSFPVRVGVAALGEDVHRGLVFPARHELRLDTDLVQSVTQEQCVGGETDQPDGAGRLHPHLTERRREIVGQGARVGLGPGH